MQDVGSILPNGSVVRDRYVVEALLGKGGFGAVYRVRDQRVRGNEFALKEVIDPKKQDRVHALFEGEVLKKLDHSALPRVYRVFEDEPHRRVYLLMDYIEGLNLERLRHQQPEKRFSLPDALRLVAPIVKAVIYLQQWQPPIIHRDIKPANIIVPPNGDEPVLVDFGISKEYDQDATTTAVRKLSPNYSAPEKYTQGTNPRTDIYGMAATLYTLLTGTPPVDAFERITQLGNQGSDPLEPVNRLVPNLPASVAEAIQRAMALAPDQRFPTMEAFWNALQPQSFLAPTPAPIPPPPAKRLSTATLHASRDVAAVPTVRVSWQDQGQRPKRRGLLLPLFACIALAAILLGALLGGILPLGNLFHSSAFSGTAPTSKPNSSIPPTQLTATYAVSVTKGPTSTPIPTPTKVPTPTPTVSALPTPTVKTQPTPVPSTYPPLDSQYTGSIHNTPGNINGTMTLTGVHQNGANISGTMTLTNGLSGQAVFTGTVSSNKTLSFLVTPYTQYLPLLFEGQVNGDGSLSGNYCSARGQQCDYASGGYGTWRVFPPAPSSDVPSYDNGNMV